MRKKSGVSFVADDGPDAAAAIFRLLSDAEADFDRGRAKLTAVRAQLAALNLPAPRPKWACPVCGIVSPTQDDLDWHLINVHDDADAGQRQGVTYYAQRA